MRGETFAVGFAIAAVVLATAAIIVSGLTIRVMRKAERQHMRLLGKLRRANSGAAEIKEPPPPSPAPPPSRPTGWEPTETTFGPTDAEGWGPG